MTNKRSIPVVILLFLVLNAPSSFSCSCIYGGSFGKYSSNRDGIVKVTILEHGPQLGHGETLHENMTVEVTEVIKGQYPKKQLTLLGDPGHLCRDYIDSKRFEIGSQHLISISSNKAIQELDGCGESSVILESGNIIGRQLVDGQYQTYSISYQDFLAQILEGVDLQR